MTRIRNLDKLMKRLNSITSRKAERMLGAVLFEGADMIAAEASHSITRGSAGGQSGGKHQHVPSAPGEPPNEEFGDLRRGIETTQPETLVAEVSSNAGHAVPLEFGTSRMEARPYLRPARDKKKREIRKRFAKQAERIVRGAAE